ncbi:MAG: NAD-dependent epimerase/dehydratase family protein [Chloroflexota bacterium]
MSELHVVFGSGAVGQATARALTKQGKRIRMVNRSGKRPADIPHIVEVLSGDLYNLDFVRMAIEGANVVYQTAQPQYHEWPEKFPPLQATILEAIAEIKGKIVVAENLYMYGEVDGPIHEDLPFSAHTRKGKVRAAMAEAVMSAHRAGQLRAVAVRAADYFGPAALSTTMGERVFIPALQGKAALLTGSLDVPHTHTYIEDFGRAMAMLGEREQADGGAWHVPSSEALTQRQLVTLFFNEIGRPVKISSAGKGMLSLAGMFIPAARESVEMLYEFEKPFVMSHAKFEKAFGNIATPHADAIKATAAWCRQYLNMLV